MPPTTTLAAQLADLQAQLATMLPPEVGAQFQAYAESLGQREFPRALRPGSPAPRFELPDQHGRLVRLDELLKQGPVVITFYRGQWCPYCSMQLRTYQTILPDLTARQAQLVAISPQTPDNSLTTAERDGLAFHVLSDAGSGVAEQFGLAFSIEGPIRDTHQGVGVDLTALNGDSSWRVPVPATYVVKPDGVIAAAWIDGDWRNRAEPADILAALDAIR